MKTKLFYSLLLCFMLQAWTAQVQHVLGVETGGTYCFVDNNKTGYSNGFFYNMRGSRLGFEAGYLNTQMPGFLSLNQFHASLDFIIGRKRLKALLGPGLNVISDYNPKYDTYLHRERLRPSIPFNFKVELEYAVTKKIALSLRSYSFLSEYTDVINNGIYSHTIFGFNATVSVKYNFKKFYDE